MNSGEGGFSFEKYSRPPETPEKRFRNELRGEVDRILELSRDPFALEIAVKIREKLDIKDLVDEIDKGKNDISSYQHWKQLGLFIVIDSTSKIHFSDPKSGLEINEGDRILDLHLPPITDDEQRKNPFKYINDSMHLIAQYIVKQDLHPKYIMGVTFEKLARVSKRQGFTIVEPQVPNDIRRGIERVYRRFDDVGINNEAMGRILLCYQDTEKFLQKYYPQGN